MTKSTIVPLVSSRLADYVVPIGCYVCHADNTHDSEHCTRCGAPMALAHQANSQGVRPRMVACLGASGVGKTVYLGMLMDMLSRQTAPMQLLARGAFSVNMQQTTIASLAHCQFPAKTPNEPERWSWIHAQVHRPGQKKPSELIMPDMAGEALAEELDHHHAYRAVRSFLSQSAAALILIDASRFRDGSGESDFFVAKLMSCLSELSGVASRAWSRRPLAIVFTKADRAEECFDDPERFARTHAADLWRQCCERFDCRRYFAASVAGACLARESRLDGRVLLPLRIEPRGIFEPLLWLLEQLGE